MGARQSDALARAGSGSLAWAGSLLGFGLGGFFDGILLHQVLQWHHLLSLVTRPPFQNLRSQLLADGVFHLLMYVLAVCGLWKLWRARQRFAAPGGDRLLLSNAAIGFGAWHILDAVLSHWILGIHRIKLDSEHVLLWDLLWLAVWGLAPVALGWWLKRTDTSLGGKTGGALLVLAILAGGPMAALPPPGNKVVMVFFKPDVTPAEVFAGITAVDGRILWAAPSGDVWALALPQHDQRSLLYQHGAWMVSSSALASGCLAWSAAR